MKDAEGDNGTRWHRVTPEGNKAYADTVNRQDANELTTLLAPNGKRSNLSNVLYHLVRTKRFKDWYSDWDIYTKQKAIKSISPIEVEPLASDEDVTKIYKAIGVVENADGRKVRFAISVIGKTLRHKG